MPTTPNARMHGFADPAEVIRRSLDAVLTPESRETVLRRAEAGYEGAYELVAVRRDGTTFPLEVMGREVTYQGRRVRVAVVRDLTERKQAEAERERLYRERAEAALVQRAFLRDVLFSVTEGRLRLVDTPADLPPSLPPFGEPVTLSPAALAQVRQRVREAAAASGLPQERAFDLMTAASECAMNAFQHGGGGAWARVCAAEGRVQVWVEDRGTGISVADLPKATLLKGHSGGGSFGHGFFLILQTVDAIHLLTGPQGTTVVLEQAATAPEPAWLSAAMEGNEAALPQSPERAPGQSSPP